jgi:thiol-disulfide isomerase/thioredoxin
MKKFIPLVIVLLICNAAFSQTQFQVLVEKPGEKTFKGIISREVVEKDTSFKWYAENLKGYTPNADAVKGLKNNADSIQLLVFMGTWCDDSHVIIPKLFALTDAAGFSKDRITLIGVDREKKTLSHLTEALNIINVPTIIVFQNGREAGRVVEYGKSGLFDKDLAEILGILTRKTTLSPIR